MEAVLVAHGLTAPRESIELTLRHPIQAISTITVRRLSAEERRRLRSAYHTKQRRGIAALMAATGLNWPQARELEQVDIEQVDAAMTDLDDELLAVGNKLTELGV